jgi:hypothetical protein
MEAAKPRLAGAVEVDHILRIEMGHLFEYTIEERRRPAKTSGGLVHLRRIIDSNAQAVNDVLSLDTCESLLFAAWRESIDQRKCVTNAESFCGHRVYSTKTAPVARGPIFSLSIDFHNRHPTPVLQQAKQVISLPGGQKFSVPNNR